MLLKADDSSRPQISQRDHHRERHSIAANQAPRLLATRRRGRPGARIGHNRRAAAAHGVVELTGATSRPNRCGRRSRTAATRYVVDSAHGNLMRNRDSASQLGDAMRRSCSPIVANACSWPTTTPCREEPRRLIRGDRVAFAMVISLAYLRSRRVDRLKKHKAIT